MGVCADRAPRFRPSRRGWARPGGTRCRLCCRQSPEFAPVRLKEPVAARCQGNRRGRGAGNTVPRPLMSGCHRLRSRVSGGNPGEWRMRSAGFDRDEPPRGERDRGGRVRPPPDRGVTRVLRLQVCASGIEARRGETRHAARREARKPGPQRQRRGRPVSGSFIGQRAICAVPPGHACCERNCHRRAQAAAHVA